MGGKQRSIAEIDNFESRFKNEKYVLSKNYLYNYFAHNNLGVALFQSGRFEEALAHFSEAIRLNPNYLQAQNNKKLVLQAMGTSE